MQAPADLDELDEPVRRYLKHSLADGVAPQGVRLRMAGRIKVGAWLAFTAEQEFSGRAFLWRARAGWGPLKPLHVVDSYRDGAGSTDGRVFGRIRFLHADDPDTAANTVQPTMLVWSSPPGSGAIHGARPLNMSSERRVR